MAKESDIGGEAAKYQQLAYQRHEISMTYISKAEKKKKQQHQRAKHIKSSMRISWRAIEKYVLYQWVYQRAAAAWRNQREESREKRDVILNGMRTLKACGLT